MELERVEYRLEGRAYSLEDFLRHNHVGGLLVLKDGSIALERYGLGNKEGSLWLSFSMTKSVVSLLVGAALHEGYIESLDEAVTAYLPRLRGTVLEGVAVRHLLQMASGLEWNEDYADPASDVASSPSTILRLMRHLASKPRVAEPGARFNYSTGETHLLGALVRSAIGNNLATYLSHRIWSPWGMEHGATWATHGPGGGEFGGCCISASLRDWGRLALFVLNEGVLRDGTAVLPEGWIDDSTAPSPANSEYGYLWWLMGPGRFRASGVFGQGVYINRESRLAVVLQGAWPGAKPEIHEAHRDAFFAAIDAALG
jgi:CubicO group peptidase (beta-lactamase class C family)